jgi:RNA polymerase sigma factor for flagellar operon FliA
MALVAAELVAGHGPLPDAAAEAAPEDVDAGARLDRLLAGRAAALAVGLLAGAGAGQGTTEAASPEEQATVREAATRVRAAVASLPERHRALVEGFYWHGEPLDVVGRRLGISKSWASRLHAQAIELLRRALVEVAA